MGNVAAPRGALIGLISGVKWPFFEDVDLALQNLSPHGVVLLIEFSLTNISMYTYITETCHPRTLLFVIFFCSLVTSRKEVLPPRRRHHETLCVCVYANC